MSIKAKIEEEHGKYTSATMRSIDRVIRDLQKMKGLIEDEGVGSQTPRHINAIAKDVADVALLAERAFAFQPHSLIMYELMKKDENNA